MRLRLFVCLLWMVFCPVLVFSQTEATNTDELLAAQYYQNKEYDKAVELYERLMAKSYSPYLYKPYLVCLIELKDFEGAEKLIKRQMRKMPNDLSFNVDYGYLLKIKGDVKKSEKEYESAIKHLSPMREQIVALSGAFLLRDEYEYAVKTLMVGRKIMDGQEPFYMELAEVYRKKQDLPAMLNEYMEAVGQSEMFVEPVEEELQKLIEFDSDGSKADMIRQSLLKYVQKEQDKIVYSEMLIWLAIQKKDFYNAFIQTKALDKRFKEDGNRVYQLSTFAVANEDYGVAVECLKYLISKGVDGIYYSMAKIDLVNVMYSKICANPQPSQSELAEMVNLFKLTIDELGKNANTVLLQKDYAHLMAFYIHDIPTALDIIAEAVDMPGAQPRNKAVCKLEMGDILLLSGDVWESNLLYAQVDKDFKDDPLGHEAKLRNARLAYYRGEFKWAQAQLDVLKAATSKLIANDAMQLSLLISDNVDVDSSLVSLSIYSRADLLFFQNKYAEALQTLDSIKSVSLSHPIFDEVMFKKAEIYSKQAQYKEAASLYEQIVKAYSEDILGDDAMFRLAELNEKVFKDNTRAMELYKDFMIKYPGSVYVVEARKRFRALRGDQVN